MHKRLQRAVVVSARSVHQDLQVHLEETDDLAHQDVLEIQDRQVVMESFCQDLHQSHHARSAHLDRLGRPDRQGPKDFLDLREMPEFQVTMVPQVYLAPRDHKVLKDHPECPATKDPREKQARS